MSENTSPNWIPAYDLVDRVTKFLEQQARIAKDSGCPQLAAELNKMSSHAHWALTTRHGAPLEPQWAEWELKG